MAKVVIEDRRHAEPQGEFPDVDHAIAELKRRAEIPWNQPPNLAPCAGRMTCGRIYEVIEYDDSRVPWRELSRTELLRISASGIEWTTNDPH